MRSLPSQGQRRCPRPLPPALLSGHVVQVRHTPVLSERQRRDQPRRHCSSTKPPSSRDLAMSWPGAEGRPFFIVNVHFCIIGNRLKSRNTDRSWDFPRGPGVRAPCFHRGGRELRPHKLCVQCGPKKKRNQSQQKTKPSNQASQETTQDAHPSTPGAHVVSGAGRVPGF